jgi:gluconokinase
MTPMSDPVVVIGVDIGTSGVKVEAVDAAAVVYRGAERHYPTDSPQPGWAEQDPGVVARATAEAIREVAAGVLGSGQSIAGIAFSSVMHSLIGLGPDGHPLTRALTWEDVRAAAQARRLRESADWLAGTAAPAHRCIPCRRW